MSRPVRAISVGKLPVVTILTLLMLALLLFAAACENLGTDAAEEATSTESSDLSVLFGTWDGTYTPESAWDENGLVDDPPVELGVPIAMHMELRPWSAESADYGTITTGTLSPARVVYLTLEGDQVTMGTSSSEVGLEDLMSVSDLTLAGDTLTGEEDPETGVPSGWISTSGSVHLTRTTPYEPTTATDATSSAPGADGGGAHAGDGADEGPDDEDDGPGREAVPVDPEPADLILGAGDNGGSSTIPVGHTVVVHFEYLPGTEIADIFCQSTSAEILLDTDESSAQDPATGHYYVFSSSFRAVAPGTADIIFRSELADGTLHQHWRYSFTVVERPRERFAFGNDQDGARATVHVNDYITVVLEYPRDRQVTSVRWTLGAPSSLDMIRNHEWDLVRSEPDEYIIRHQAGFVAYEPGDCALQLISYHESDGEHHIWQIHLTVRE